LSPLSSRCQVFARSVRRQSLYQAASLLVGGLLDRRRRRFGCYFALRDRHRDIVDNAADRWAEILVEEVVMVGGLGQDLGDLPEQRIRYRRRRALVYGDIAAVRRSFLGVF